VAKQYQAALHFVHGLRSDISQFVQARTIDDVTSNELFDPHEGLFAGAKQNDAIAVEDLMVFMVKRGYRFAAAKSNGEQVYLDIYDRMVDYYMDLHAIQTAMEKTDSEIAELEREGEELLRNSRWDPTNDLIRALSARPPENLLEYGLMLARDVASAGESIQRQNAVTASPKSEPKWTEFEVGNRVTNKGYKIWWWGHIVEVNGNRYRVEMSYVNSAFQGKWRKGSIYEFTDGQMKRKRDR